MKRIALLIITCILLASCSRHILFENGNSEYCIVIDENASASEQYAATELRDWVAQVSGVQLPIKGLSEGTEGKRLIVGYNKLVEELVADAEPQSPSDDAFTWCNKGGDILLWGGSERGTLYSVYDFLEEELGCRWYSLHVSVAPKQDKWSFGKLYNHEAPAFKVRDVAFINVRLNPAFSGRLRTNFVRLPGQKPGETLPGTSEGYWGCHSMGGYITAAEYFAEHPEYFGMHNGERFSRGSEYQLCLSNPDVLRICTEKIRKAMRENPDYMFYSMEQLDNVNPCECEECQAIAKKYGGESGVMIWFVNQVADAVKDEFPDKYVGTFAYRYTRHAPKNIVPRDNVVVRLCSIECCMLHEYDECEDNREFYQDLCDWSEIAPNLYIWDYVTDFNYYCLPVANLKTVQPHIIDFLEHNAIGVMEQGDGHTNITEFMELRTYLLAKLLWNPYEDVDAIIRDFTDGFYGAAAPYIREYIEYSDKYLRRKGMHTDCYAPVSHEMFTPEFAEKGREIFAKAKKAVADMPEIHDRVENAEFPLCVIQLELSPAEGIKSGALDIYKKVVERIKVRNLDEYSTIMAPAFIKYMDQLAYNIENAPEMPATEVPVSGNGISYTRYEGDFVTTVQMLERGKVAESGTMETIAIDEDPLKDHFGYVFEGMFKAEEDGMHLFRVITDDGAVMFIDGQEVLNRDGSHSKLTAWTAVNLKKGLHRFSIRYFDDSEGQTLDLHMITPEGYEGPITTDRLFVIEK